MVDFPQAIWTPSPSFWSGRYGYEPQYIVCHGTDGQAPGCVNWLCNPQAGASTHYVVTRDGSAFQLVSEYDSAWGNGIIEQGSQFWGQSSNPNWWTVSVESERWDTNSTPITAAQQATLTALVADIRKRWGPLPLIPHSAISPLSRAHCPGPGYPMDAIDHAAPPPPPPGSVVRLKQPFSATPQRTPLVFYHDWSFKHPAYTSAATTQTVLHFDQYTYGPPVHDPTTGTDDYLWWHRHNPAGACGWVPSAWLVGSPPGNPPVRPPT